MFKLSYGNVFTTGTDCNLWQTFVELFPSTGRDLDESLIIRIFYGRGIISIIDLLTILGVVVLYPHDLIRFIERDWSLFLFGTMRNVSNVRVSDGSRIRGSIRNNLTYLFLRCA